MSGLLRAVALLAPLAAGLAWEWSHGPIPQDPFYHRFADERTWLGIPRFGDVVTNLPFVVIGALGLRFLARRGRAGPDGPFREPRERAAYLVCFAGLLLTGFGSAYYHWAPDNDRLFWDRLPLTPVLMSLFCIVIAERIDARLGARLLAPLVLAGAGSVVYWHLGERAGAGDLRPYALVQFYPMIAIPLVLLLYPSRYTHGGYFWGVLAGYALAKGFERMDREIFAITGVVSGHNLKHCAAAAATGCVLWMLGRRRAVT